MTLITADFSDGQVLTATKMNEIANAIIGHTHGASDNGGDIPFTSITGATADAVSTSPARSGSGGGSGRGSTVQNHIDTVGTGTVGDSNPHGIGMDDIGWHTSEDSRKNDTYIWFPALACSWEDASGNSATTIQGVNSASAAGGTTGVSPGEPEGMVVKDGGNDAAYFTFPFTHSLSGTEIAISILFYVPHANTGNVEWRYEFIPMSGIASIGPGVNTTIGPYTANSSSYTNAITSAISGGGFQFWQSIFSVDPSTESISDNDVVRVRILRDSNTMNGTVVVQGFFVSYTTDFPLTV